MKPSDTVPDPFKPPTDLIVVTTPFVSGYHVTRVIGTTFGLIVRSRGLGQNIFAFFRAWGGGEIKVYTTSSNRCAIKLSSGSVTMQGASERMRSSPSALTHRRWAGR
jgi:hypothetical protein